MTIPTIDISDGRDLSQLAQDIAAQLCSYPYFVKATGFDLSKEQGELVELTKALASLAPVARDDKGEERKRKRVSFTRVEIDPETAGANRPVTAYSRSAMALPPHTDSSYSPLPHEFVAFMCALDDTGGDNMMVPIDHILSYMDAVQLRMLAKPLFPFTKRRYAVLEGEPDGWSIRYYRAQIDRAVSEGQVVSDECAAALEALDALIERPENQIAVKLAPGEALLMHNKKVLHGRTAISPTSDRLLYRIRYNMDLDAIAAGPTRQGWFARLMDRVAPVKKTAETSPATFHTPPEFKDDEAPGDLPARPTDTLLTSFEARLKTGGANPEVLFGLAHILMAKGRFFEARQYANQCLEAEPDHGEALKIAAALNHRLDENEKAQALQKAYASVLPFEIANGDDEERPTLLQPRGVSGASFSVVKKNGWYQTNFEGGHFALRNLCPHQDYNAVVFNIFDEPTTDGVPAYDLVLNNIACADRMPVSLKALEAFLGQQERAGTRRPVINHPRQVLKTSRVENAATLNSIENVVFPATAAINGQDLANGTAASTMEQAGIEFPVIVRPKGSHTGSGVHLAHDETSLARYAAGADASGDFYLIQYHDLKDDRGLFNKMRLFCIDGVWYPVACLTHNEWNVHSGDRYAVMDKNGFTQEKERAFLGDMPTFLRRKAMDALTAIERQVGLDFFGVDATVLPDGGLFIFECNAAMRHNFDHVRGFPYTEPYLTAISSAFAEMIEKRLKEAV